MTRTKRIPDQYKMKRLRVLHRLEGKKIYYAANPLEIALRLFPWRIKDDPETKRRYREKRDQELREAGFDPDWKSSQPERKIVRSVSFLNTKWYGRERIHPKNDI